MEDRPELKAAAARYAKNGIPVFPLHWALNGVCSCAKGDCHSPGKHPLTPRGFKDATTDEATVAAWWKKWPSANIAIPTGSTTGLLVVDCDPRNGGPRERAQLIERFGHFPETDEAITGGGGRHVYFHYPGGSVPKELDLGIDLKGDGGYVVAPPSIHSSGKPYLWDGMRDGEQILNPAEAPLWLLERVQERKVRSEGSGNPQRPNVVPNGRRHDAIVSLAGTLRRRGDSEGVAYAACRALEFESPVSDEDIREQVADVYHRYSAGSGTSDNSFSGWPKPEPIESELPQVQAFSEVLLPESFRPLARDVSERMQVPMDYPAIAIVLSLAGTVNRRAAIQPKANDTGWLVVPNLWGGIIAPPGLMKSPVIHAVTCPLKQIQTQWREDYEHAQIEHARAKEEHGLKCAVWRDQFKASAKKGIAGPDRPEDEPQGPTMRRLIVNDATVEALHETMSENPSGVLVIRDELTGWLSQLDRAGREGERAFCLEAWNGDSSFTVDRIGRGMIHVPHCCMSMLGGIQPGRLRSYLVDALVDGPSNDGLIQRFQLLVWPNTVPDWTYVDRPPDAASEQQAGRVFRRLVELSCENPMKFRFATDAHELFTEWLTELESKLRGDQLHPALVSHLSKYRSLMPSLALLFEIADRAAGGFDDFEGPDPGQFQNSCVSVEHARQAAAFCDYLESHAQRIYSCVVSPQLRAAGELADKIKMRRIGGDGSFSVRDVYLKGWSILSTPEAVRSAARILEDAGWLRAVSGESGPIGGRPSDRYQVNPRLWE